MYYKIPNGTVERVDNNAGFIAKCWLPPLGYGVNKINGKVDRTDIIKCSHTAKQQKWVRTELPKDWSKKRADEIRKQSNDPDYYDPELEAFREQEDRRRIYGVWVYINGNPYYLTGNHYMYLNWWFVKKQFPDFRDCDRRRYYFDLYCQLDPNCLGMCEASNRRSGKCLAKGTKIRMYDGSLKNVEDIKEGELVMGDDHSSRSVFGLTCGHEEMFEVTPNKGIKFTCNKSHILTLKWNAPKHSKYFYAEKNSVINISVGDYIKLPFWVKDHLVLYKRGWGDEFEKKEHYIPPYMLGVYLGDGCRTYGHISTPDKEISDYLEVFAKERGLRVTKGDKLCHRIVKTEEISEHENPYRKELRRLGLIGFKYIPKDYLLDCKENRLQLLAGIIDTDGHLCIKKNKQAGYEITLKDKELINGVVELARSLGYSCSLNSKIATMKREDGSIYKCKVYRTIISGAYNIPCKVERKKTKSEFTRVDLTRTGFKVKSVGWGEYYGFAVDRNHLFLLEDGIVCHNSFRSMLFLYERVSIMPNSNGGIQSKTDPDVNNLYAEKLKTPFLRLPDFLRPEIDEMSGVNNGMSFTKTRKRGKGAMDNAGDLGLNSEISFRSSVEGSYDGYELYAYVADEVAKPSKADTYERHKIVRYCLRVGTNFVGKALYTTTTEEIKGISMDNSPFKKLWDESDPNERDANGLTKSWLYRYLMPAQETLAFDEYGFPTIKENITFIKNSREVFKGKMKDYLDEIKKNPMNVEEMFMATLDNECHFDDELIVEQVEMLKYTNPTIRGNLIWENGLQDSNVIFVEDKKGNWEIVKEVLKFVEGKKMVERRGSMSYPLNVMTFTIGTDPFDHDITVDARNSKGAFLVEAKDTPLLPDPIRETEVCMYLFRPKSSTIFYEDVLKTCVFFGCDMLFENQKINIKKHFINRGYEAFLVKLKGREEYGVPSSETTKMAALEMAVNRIKFNVHKMYFIKLLEQSLVFDIRYTEKYDAVMAWFYTLISNDNRIVKNKATEKTREVEDVIPRWLLDD